MSPHLWLTIKLADVLIEPALRIFSENTSGWFQLKKWLNMNTPFIITHRLNNENKVHYYYSN